jgi:hypothetical protein
VKKADIKRHLKDYSISARTSTISHAFASALSVADNYNLERIDAALRLLGQDPESDLKCAYCDKLAETWDHINAIVKKTVFTGNGHQINNLLPCCKDCNSSKGNKDWKVFLVSKKLDTRERILRIEKYISFNSVDLKEILDTKYAADLKEFYDIKTQVFDLFKKADKLDEIIRTKIRSSITNNP